MLIELAKFRDLVIIEREKRNKAVEELEFSLSDFADESKQFRVGEFLVAQYLVTGSIFELGSQLVAKMLYFLYYVRGLTLHEIADGLEKPEGTIKYLLHRLRQQERHSLDL